MWPEFVARTRTRASGQEAVRPLINVPCRKGLNPGGRWCRIDGIRGAQRKGVANLPAKKKAKKAAKKAAPKKAAKKKK
jgi:hypothetical protein